MKEEEREREQIKGLLSPHNIKDDVEKEWGRDGNGKVFLSPDIYFSRSLLSPIFSILKLIQRNIDT